MKIYTKSGDRGTTTLFGGKRVSKSSLRIEAYGNIDELNSLLGIVVLEISNVILNSFQDLNAKRNSPQGRIIKRLLRIQAELFVLGTDLSSPNDLKIKVPRVSKGFVARLEAEIDRWDKQLPQLKNFILPGGSYVGANLHLARTVARRAERCVVHLAIQEKINENTAIYINRLSDWLFVLARYMNKLTGYKEIPWKGRD